ncbi:endonuclease/exonuclease/phosphatase family protein [Mycobacterium sp. C31M]
MSNIYARLRVVFKNRPDELARCAEHILALRKAMSPIRKHRSDDSLLLATWNIRDFDGNGFKFGPRKDESFYYIAEVISTFDLVAVQEINRSLEPLRRVMDILGGGWDYIVTDATEGVSGNDERMAFLFNKDKVFFRKIAGEVVLPQSKTIVAPKDAKRAPKERPEIEGNGQFARTPFLVAFQSGWFKFSLCTVHIYYGEDSGDKLKRRIQEIEKLVAFFADRQDREIEADKLAAKTAGRAYSRVEAENYILLGDFNVISPEHATAHALRKRGFSIPDKIDGDQVREDGAHYYDQIAVRVQDKRFEVETGGMFDVYDHVFRDDQLDAYRGDIKAARDGGATNDRGDDDDELEYYQFWRTFQMSDHSPLWVKIKTDFADAYLQSFVDGPGGEG